MSGSRIFLGLLLPLSWFPATLAAQGVPVRVLAKPEAEFPEPFTMVAGVRELRDGRVVVADPRDRIVQLVDFRTGNAERIGREGSGPGEYALPQRLVALPGDSSAVYDILNSRLLVITPQGKPGGFLELPQTGGGRGTVVLGATGLVTDAKGTFYSAGAPFRTTAQGIEAVDSVAIERWNRSTGKRDTVAYVRLPQGSAKVSGSGGNVAVRVGGGNPFSPQVAWAVAPDGRVAIVHPEPYRVEYVEPNGSRVTGPIIPYDRIRVTEAHKEQWRQGVKSSGMAIMVEQGPGGRKMQAGPVPNVPDPGDWPEYLPPFLGQSGQFNVIFASDGLLWVRRTGPADAAPLYDVIDRSGRVAFKVQLAKRSRVVGFGNGTVYVVRSDEDDLQYLQRFRTP